MKKFFFPIIIGSLLIIACDKADSNTSPTVCTSDKKINRSRGECSQTLSFASSFSEVISGNTRTITSNSIPNHHVGLFGSAAGSLNPNAIKEQNISYAISTSPSMNTTATLLLNNGPQYSFGIALNGVEFDPVAAEPFPHKGLTDPHINWQWNLEATNVSIGLDCNNAHVQPQGKYHYHGVPTKYIEKLANASTKMTIIGWAADGFPIYYKYGYTTANSASSPLKELKPSWRLKSGKRPGDGITAPCDTYTGVYSNDYEYVKDLGDLDSLNGRSGVTPEFPSGTYYYVVTDSFPSLPRYFKGTPSNSFKIGQGR